MWEPSLSQGRGLGTGGRVAAHPSRPGRPPPPERAGMVSTWAPGPRPSPTRGNPPFAGRGWVGEGGRELRRGPRTWGRGTSGLYHCGGGGGGPGPGVCGSPPRSRARRFHFPGCPGVNIRVSTSLLPRRAAATFLPRPGPARARPPRSRLSANEHAGPQRSPSMERGTGGGAPKRGSEGRGLRVERGGARWPQVGWAAAGWVGRHRARGAGAGLSGGGRSPGRGSTFYPLLDPTPGPVGAAARGGTGTVPVGLRAGMRKALGLGGVSPSPPHPVHALAPAAHPELVRPAGQAHPGERE